MQSPTRYRTFLRAAATSRDIGGHAAADGRTVRWGLRVSSRRTELFHARPMPSGLSALGRVRANL